MKAFMFDKAGEKASSFGVLPAEAVMERAREASSVAGPTMTVSDQFACGDFRQTGVLLDLQALYVVHQVENTQVIDRFILRIDGVEHGTPNRHIPGTVRRDYFLARNIVADSGIGELAAILLRQLGQVRGCFLQSNRSGTIAFT
jgi:hypothetical protein